MAYPAVARLELPILQELAATGGSDDVRFLYSRLVAYFPQLEEDESRALKNGHRKQWRRLVQRAGRALSDQRQIERRHGFWTITESGRKRVNDESLLCHCHVHAPLATLSNFFSKHRERTLAMK